MTTFGWVITPAAKDAQGTNTLNKENQAFIEKLRGSFEMIWVEDHFQWSDRPMLECWTTLVYLAASYPEFHFGPLVLGQSYRNPALTAKMFSTLHWLTSGRMVAGIGAGWKEDEYLAYGWTYPEPSVRIAQLEDAVQIIRSMWGSSPASFDGQHYKIAEAYGEPRPSPPPPLLIAGGGEQLTLRVVAQHADWMNVGFCDVETYSRKLDALRKHCDDVGRNYDEIKKTYFAITSIYESEPDDVPQRSFHLVQGTPTQVLDEYKQFIDLGVEHFMVRFVDFPEQDGVDLFLDQVMPALP
jgi:alkanesulfonate monooxygenase SsuD/methylene tetrahydromethanopterin reductase-like flavin-dependent oxidoreductase (luciferase family)